MENEKANRCEYDMFSTYEDVVSVDDVMNMLHIGRSNVYKLLKERVTCRDIF